MALAAQRTVTSTVNYLVPPKEGSLYIYHLVEPPEGRSTTNQLFDPHEVTIRSLRDGAEPYKLDTHGFELVRFAPKVDDIYDPANIENQLYPQVTELLKRHLGVSEVRIFVPFLRGPEAQRRMPGSLTMPADTVHVDFTEDSGPQCFKERLGALAEELRGRRFAVINVWRPITGPLRDRPLALCDARTVSPSDLLIQHNISRADATGLRTPDGDITVGEIYSVAHNPSHQWYYVPDMMPDEALLLKNYDSRKDGVSRFSPHTAFVDPNTPADALPRASIEVRTLVVW